MEAVIKTKSQQLHTMDGKLNEHTESIFNLKKDLDMKGINKFYGNVAYLGFNEPIKGTPNLLM